MHEEGFVIFAGLKREHFEEILEAVMGLFPQVQFGRQGDDWIWAHIGEDKIEIDSFFSNELELKGKRSLYSAAQQILGAIDEDWVLKRFHPPKEDLTR